ncbi:hypothetical protein ACLOJK_040155 [Asimina triloba]
MAHMMARIILYWNIIMFVNILLKQGMKPVISTKGMEKEVEKRNKLHAVVQRKEDNDIVERSCNCTPTTLEDSPDNCTPTTLEDSADKPKIAEPLSAPF